MSKSYIFKYKFIKHKKIAAFNFKILNNILPCNVNLYKWKIQNDDKCRACGEIETILHLLFECQNKKKLWKLICQATFQEYNLVKLLFGYNDLSTDWAFSVIQYCVFKVWLLNQENNLYSSYHSICENIVADAKYINKLYQMNKYNGVSTILQRIIDSLLLE